MLDEIFRVLGLGLVVYFFGYVAICFYDWIRQLNATIDRSREHHKDIRALEQKVYDLLRKRRL